MQRLYKRADSQNWYVNLGGGKYASTGCRDRRAAEARARELERRRHDPPGEASYAPPLGEALKSAVKERRDRGRSAGTLAMYKTKAGHLVDVLGADTPLDQIDAAAVDRFTTQRLEEGACRNTIAKELGVLRVTLKLARRRREYALDPAAVLPQGWAAGYKPRTRYLTPDEARRLLADLCDDELDQRRGSMRNRAAMVAYILATSARWGEAERARREDVGRELVTLRGTKTAGAERAVPVLPSTAPLLRLALEHGREEGLLFEPWGNVRRDLHEACARIGIPPCSPNDLRRTTATWLRAAGVEPHLIAAVLGHADGRMCERVYGRMPPEALRAALLERTGKVALLLPTGTTAARGKRRKAGGSR